MLPNKNIINVLNDIKLFGAPCSLTVVSPWDNTLEIQVPPELHLGLCLGTRKTSTVLQLAPDNVTEDSGEEGEEEEKEERARSENNLSMESLALRRGKRKCQKPQYDMDKLLVCNIRKH